jgi:hypothetical protein
MDKSFVALATLDKLLAAAMVQLLDSTGILQEVAARRHKL